MEQLNDKYHRYLNREEGHDINWSDEEQELKKVLDQSAELRPDGFGKSKDEIWQAIDDAVSDEDETSTRSLEWYKVIRVAAAVVLLIIAGITVYNNIAETVQQGYVTHTVGEQANEVIALPDGSTASLNSVSSLVFEDNDHSEWNRTLELQGEAFFEVTKGETFTVNTKLGSVKVLGTSFNVSTRDDVFAVSCKTGKVEVSFAGGERPAEILTKGQKVVFENDGVLRVVTDTERIGQWIEGTYYYESRPVSEAFDEIERQYNVELKYKDKAIASRLFNGYFFKEDLKTSLDMVCDAMGLSYQLDGRKVMIESNPE